MKKIILLMLLLTCICSAVDCYFYVMNVCNNECGWSEIGSESWQECTCTSPNSHQILPDIYVSHSPCEGS